MVISIELVRLEEELLEKRDGEREWKKVSEWVKSLSCVRLFATP